LVEVLKLGRNDFVSQYAALNPNCSNAAKIYWTIDVTKQLLKENNWKAISDLAFSFKNSISLFKLAAKSNLLMAAVLDKLLSEKNNK